MFKCRGGTDSGMDWSKGWREKPYKTNTNRRAASVTISQHVH